MKKLYATLMCAAMLGLNAHGQTAQRVDPATRKARLDAQQRLAGNHSPDSTTLCKYKFISGSGNTYLNFCVTKNGNIAKFESPSKQEYIQVGTIGEGYGFCDYDSETEYYDYAGYGDSGNWQAASTVSSSGTSVKISRKTSDGIYTLTQTITQNASNALAQVTMALKNNASGSHHVGLLRYADVDASGNADNNFDYTYRTGFGWNESGYGLQLAHVSGFALNGGFSQIVASGPNPCQIFQNVGNGQAIDGSIFIEYDMELGGGKTGTTVDTYKSF
jgi:hypothetical protein